MGHKPATSSGYLFFELPSSPGQGKKTTTAACLLWVWPEKHFYPAKHKHIHGDSISEYKFKRGFKPEGERIKNVMEEIFHVAPQDNGGKLTINYGAIKELKAWVENKKLFVETQSDLTVKDTNVILDTNKKFRDFLEEATGFTAKERLKQAKKEVQAQRKSLSSSFRRFRRFNDRSRDCLPFPPARREKILRGVEEGMKSHEWVPVEDIEAFTRIGHKTVEYRLNELVDKNVIERYIQSYVGYRLKFDGYDILAIDAFVKKETITALGDVIGVGKESVVIAAMGLRPCAIKFHREGRSSFKQVETVPPASRGHRDRELFMAVRGHAGGKARVRRPGKAFPRRERPGAHRLQPERCRHERGRRRGNGEG